MKHLACMALTLILLFACAQAEDALTVNGLPVPAAEARLYLISAESSYAEIADYYRELLGIDYWTLTTVSGMSAAEAVKSDVFRELVTMYVFYGLAEKEGLTLSPEEAAACREDARAYYASLTLAEAEGIEPGDVESLIRKQRLADQMYSRLLSCKEIDEDAVTASIDRSAWRTYRVDYLLCPETSEAAADRLSALRAADWSSLGEASVISGRVDLCAAEDSRYEALCAAAARLSVGETSGVIKTDYGLFIIRLADDSDDSAYRAAVESALYAARSAAFEADANALIADAEYTINVAFWDSVALGSAAPQQP